MQRVNLKVLRSYQHTGGADQLIIDGAVEVFGYRNVSVKEGYGVEVDMLLLVLESHVKLVHPV